MMEFGVKTTLGSDIKSILAFDICPTLELDIKQTSALDVNPILIFNQYFRLSNIFLTLHHSILG